MVPALGSVPLDKLAVEDLDLFYARLLTEGRKSKSGEISGPSPKTVLNIHLVPNKAPADAYRKGTVVRNVAALADAPSLSARRRPEIKAWDADQLARLLDALASHHGLVDGVETRGPVQGEDDRPVVAALDEHRVGHDPH